MALHLVSLSSCVDFQLQLGYTVTQPHTRSRLSEFYLRRYRTRYTSAFRSTSIFTTLSLSEMVFPRCLVPCLSAKRTWYRAQCELGNVAHFVENDALVRLEHDDGALTCCMNFGITLRAQAEAFEAHHVILSGGQPLGVLQIELSSRIGVLFLQI